TADVHPRESPAGVAAGVRDAYISRRSFSSPPWEGSPAGFDPAGDPLLRPQGTLSALTEAHAPRTVPQVRVSAARPVSICIVNHNGERELVGTLDAVAAHAPAMSEVIVIDNASEDRSVAL